ncbi:hypothetical protein Acr_19g0009050 [Actinidia rufa]|uniref:Uncharacterized protein n=1 Tax=Actinidia rufa TaxID=165716 RepID=A0A7J0GB94_9ERIC|nr:hypothetical protein Acr_19g0009050 [Actinidia rufa]
MKSSTSPLYHGSSRKQEKQGQGPAQPKKFEREASIDINERADAFIKQFKQHLLIQRLESIENYEQMLARGT